MSQYITNLLFFVGLEVVNDDEFVDGAEIHCYVATWMKMKHWCWRKVATLLNSVLRRLVVAYNRICRIIWKTKAVIKKIKTLD